MALPSIFPFINPAFLSSLRCCETVGCANGNSFTMSPQMQVSTLVKYSIIATRAGCPKAFAKVAIAFCLSVKCSVLVAPIVYLYFYNAILRYRFKIEKKVLKFLSRKSVRNFWVFVVWLSFVELLLTGNRLAIVADLIGLEVR